MPHKRILMVCGSPRSARSASRATAEYLARFLDFDHEWLDVRSLGLSMDPREADAGFQRAVEKLQAADAVVWVFGAWSLFVPIELQRLFEKLLLHPECKLEGKLAASVMTSVRISDDEILERVRLVSEHLGLGYLGDVSAEGNPFLGYFEDEEQTEASCRILAQRLNQALEDGYRPARRTRVEPLALSPLWRGEAFEIAGPPAAKTSGRTVLVLSGHALSEAPAGASVVEGIRRWSKSTIEVVELAHGNVRPCTGCFQCLFQEDGRCSQGDEGNALMDRMHEVDGIVLVGACSCAYLDTWLKTFLDRSFSQAHRPVLQGKQGFVVAAGGGSLEPAIASSMALMLQARGIHILDTLSPSSDTPERFAATLKRTVEDLDRAMEQGWTDAGRFSVRAIHRLFSDITANNGMMMRADYRHYREHGFLVNRPGKMQPLLRVLFRSRYLERRLIAAAQRAVARGKATRLEALKAQGVRLGAGRKLE